MGRAISATIPPVKPVLHALAIWTLAFAAVCLAQDSLGDLARQQRWAKPATPAPHEITNDDIATSASTPAANSSQPTDTTSTKKEAPNAAEVQAKIRAQKGKVKALEDKIATDQKQLAKHDPTSNSGLSIYEHAILSGSPDTSYCDLPDYTQQRLGYKDWCDEPDKLQDDIDTTQKQLDSERAILDSMQEEARQQGFGNSIYDPD